MRTVLPGEDAHSKKLSALAGHWRKSAAQTIDPYQSDRMRRTADELEKAAARATCQWHTAQTAIAANLFASATPFPADVKLITAAASDAG
jgi:hypothetical protein